MRALLVPVKSFAAAKHRLSGVLDDHGRAELARRLGTIVLEAGAGIATYVACDDGEVADWALSRNAFVLWTPGLGLSGAVQAGVRHLGREGYSLVVVAHADLPFASLFATFGAEGEVTLAPDWRHDGTNVAAVPAGVDFTFSYGPGSFRRHTAEAERLGLELTVVDDEGLSKDIDLPSDLDLVAGLLQEANIRPVAVHGKH